MTHPVSPGPRLFPGNGAVTDLQVYSDAAPDGLFGGSPHLHTVSTEAYVVTGGSGALDTLDATGGGEVERHPLSAGTVLWFSPGVIHRAMNFGGLRVLAVMSNSGLPEAGDAVLTFPPDVLEDADAYARAATLPEGTRDERRRAAAARRDLAVTGFGMLQRAIAERGPEALHEFHERAVTLVRDRSDEWRERFRATEELTARTASDLDAVAHGSAVHLAEGSVVVADHEPEEPAFGMCGLLHVRRVPPPSG